MISYKNDVDSFVIVSSDSDYWGLISSLPDAHFLVMIEREKCGPDMKEALADSGIFYCYLDDFYSGNSEDIKKNALFKEMYRWMELYKMLPYLVTIIVLVAVSMRKKRENEPPAALGLAYFREERSFQSSTVFAVELCYYALLAATGRVFMPQGGKKHVV